MSNALLHRLYYDVKSATAYTSRKKVYDAAKLEMPEITRKIVDEWFAKQYAATIHKPIRHRFQRNRVYVKGVDEQYQSDLVDVSREKASNDGITFLLTCIDCFSRYAWVVPVKSKSGPEIARALQSIFNERVCKRLQTDKGKEYLNKHVRALCDKYNIVMFTTENEVKASIVERFNRTLMTRVAKYFSANNTRRYLDTLPSLVFGYNHTRHRSIGVPPANVNRVNAVEIRQKLYGSHVSQTKKYKYNVEDHVRISKSKRQFAKGYHANWSDEVFIVDQRVKRVGTEPVYRLRDLGGEDIEGTFYEKELQHVELPEEHRIERVLKTRKRRGKTSYFVKWQGWGDKFNSWIDDLHNVQDIPT